jgi:hypothetical protein
MSELHVAVFEQFKTFVGEHPLAGLVNVPIFVGNPVVVLHWVSTSRPLKQLVKELMIKICKTVRAGEVIVRPTSNHWIEVLDE